VLFVLGILALVLCLRGWGSRGPAY